MELFERMNRAFGGWYEGLFGGSDDVRPRDILRRILAAMEEHRKEGIDNRVYVPNQYILEIAVDDEEEKEYLLSFLDRDELEAAVRRYCQQNGYQIRGALDFTIREVELEQEGKRREKVRVRCRYDSKLAAEKPLAAPTPEPEPEMEPEPVPAGAYAREDETVMGEPSDEGTVPAFGYASLLVATPGAAAYDVPINRPAITIGRSARVGNDLVLDQDGLVSRRHARIELEADGKYTLYDLGTTNGTRLNGKKVENAALSSGDEIVVGATRLTFTQPDGALSVAANGASRSVASSMHPAARLVLTDGERDHEQYVLASDTVIGRGATNDIVLDDRSVATRHARIRRGDPFTIEPLDPAAITLLNGAPISAGQPSPIRTGDRIALGALTLRFEGGAR